MNDAKVMWLEIFNFEKFTWLSPIFTIYAAVTSINWDADMNLHCMSLPSTSEHTGYNGAAMLAS